MYGRVLIAAATARSTAAMVETARADRELAGNRREAGQVTDADVLRLDVYLARTLEQQVQATSDERIARARLNQLMGEPLSTIFSLDLTPPGIAIDITNPASLEEEAVKNRPEVALALQQEQLAAASVDAAQAAFLPQVAAQGAWELNGGSWNARSSSWGAGVVARVNLFHARAAGSDRETVRRDHPGRGSAAGSARGRPDQRRAAHGLGLFPFVRSTRRLRARFGEPCLVGKTVKQVHPGNHAGPPAR